MKLYKTYILPLLEYGSIAFLAAPISHLEKLQKVQNEGIRICLGLPRYIRINLLHECAGLDKVEDRLKKLNQRLLQTMSRENADVRILVENRHLLANLNPKSPLDKLQDCA